MANSELKNTKNGWFRNLLFGKKKTVRAQKRVACECGINPHGTKKDQMVQTNSYADCKEEDKLPILNVNTYADPNKIQKPGECPGKIFPMERRGCGFHLYFCVDNGGKPNLGKNNKIKRVKNEKNQAENCKEVISSISETNSLAGTVRSNQSHPPLQHSGNTNSTGRDKSPSEPYSSVGVLSGIKKSKESEVGKQISNSPKNQEENKSGKGSSILRMRKTSSQNMLIENVRPEATSVYRYDSSPERPTDHKETEVKKAKSDLDEEAVFKEYEALQRQKSMKRRSTLKSRGTLARNSLISLRKRKQSFVDTMLPEILSKLDHIELKLTELEKVYEDKGTNITNVVGISCNGTKSTLSIDIKNQDDELNKKCSNTKPLKLNSFRVQPVIIKSYGEDVFVNEPESVSVVKRMRSRQGSNQLVYHNTQELDAHNITSKSFRQDKRPVDNGRSFATRTVKSHNLKTAVKVGAQSMEVADNEVSDMWRRISEELKS